MTTMTDPPKESFRLSMLINDKRYRSNTFQFIALIALVGLISYLASNLVTNLREADLNISFDFLEDPASYDINQTLIDYTSRDTNLRAAIVGVLNTLLVAFLACVTATVFGVIAGVLRLSNNWLIRKLMSVYVEIFRNVPVLIWIIIIFTIMTAVLPAPNAFRGTDPSSSMLFDAAAFTNRGIYLPAPVAGPGGMVVLVVFLASILGVFAYRRYAKKLLFDTGRLLPTGWPSAAILFVPAALVWVVMALTAGAQQNTLYAPTGMGGQTLAEYVESQGGAAMCLIDGQSSNIVTKTKVIKQQAAAITGPMEDRVALRVSTVNYPSQAAAIGGFAQGGCNLLTLPSELPADLQPLVAASGLEPLTTTVREGRPFEFDRPYLSGFNFNGGITVFGALIALWFALAIYTGAFIAENVRAGIQAVSKGQTEAAASLGMRPNRIMNLVVLPQALRVIVPPLISQYLNITKNSSLAIAVGYMDITATLGGITLSTTGRAIECVLLLMAFYLIISLSISAVMNIYNNSIKLKER